MKKELSQLTEIQHFVTQENGTELPYQNEFWNFFEQGVYLDLISGVPLFLSLHKFKSACGWPAFHDQINEEDFTLIEDLSHGMKRVEVRSKHSNSHLGHLFDDGPAPTFKRYCINSAALSFISLEELKNTEYSDLIYFFKGEKNE